MGSDHFPIQISLDKPLKRNTPLTEPRYRFDKTDDDLLHNTLNDSLNNIDTDIMTQDELEELAVTLGDKLMKAVDSSTPKSWISSKKNVGLGGCTIALRILTPNPSLTSSRKKLGPK